MCCPQPRLMSKFQTGTPSARDWRSLTTVNYYCDNTIKQLTRTYPLNLFCDHLYAYPSISVFITC